MQPLFSNRWGQSLNYDIFRFDEICRACCSSSMSRPLRIQFPGAVYHVMCRGNRQGPIFGDRTDHERFLETLGETCGRCGWLVHAYVLMGNHYHLLLETPEPNLVDGMRWFQGVYTQRFNARHQVGGHLFQGRYKSLLVDRGEYFATVAGYIHLNPARAGSFDLNRGSLADFEWSSYRGYLRPADRPEWLIAKRVLQSLGFEDDPAGRARYCSAMQTRVAEIAHSDHPEKTDDVWRKIRQGWIFGSDRFCDDVRAAVNRAANGTRRDSHSGGAALQHDEQAAEELLEKGMSILRITRSSLAGMKKGDDRKKAIAWLIRKNTSVKNEWISKALQMGNVATVSRSVGAVETASEGCLFELKAKMSEFKD